MNGPDIPQVVADTHSPDSRAAWVEAVIRQSLSVIRPSASAVDGSADLAQEADLDSAEVMDMIMEIEDRLDISIPVETTAQARTINELCAGILQLNPSMP